METFRKHLFFITAIGCILLLAGMNACTKETGGNSSDTAASVEKDSAASIADLLAAMNMYYFRDARQAPDFELPSVTDGKISLSRYRGKVVLLSFWTTW
ncbi:MAG: redoxin domain-containing protein [Deferribacteres bacterium]|nr:redoxin domain-containing protein [Deferribacteres bacterium]